MLKDVFKELFGIFKGEVNYINGSITLPPPLEKDEELKTLMEYENGSISARDKLIVHNLRLVVYVAKRYETNIYNLEDLISIGTLGLIKAIQTFKYDKNIKLATYASRCIDNEILMFLRKKAKLKNEVSLDEPLKCDYDGNELLLGDIICENENLVLDNIDDLEEKDELHKAIDTLTKREKEILNMRFGLDGNEYTQKETAEILGISQSYISRLEKKIIKKLQNCLKK